MAAALVDIYGDVKFEVGPAIGKKRLYYDIELPRGRAYRPEDFRLSEARMAEIVGNPTRRS